MSRNILIGIVVVIVIAAGAWWYLNQNSAQSATAPTTELQTQQSTTAPASQSSNANTQTTPTPSSSTASSAAIDAGTLTQHLETGASIVYPSMSGTASGTNGILFTIKGTNSYGPYDSTYSKVVNGRWSVTFNDPLPVGTYTAEVLDNNTKAVLTTATLVVVQ